jgi:hypothetical protein
VVDAESLFALEAIRDATVDAFPAEFPLEMRLIGAVPHEGAGIRTSLVTFDRKKQCIQEIVHGDDALTDRSWDGGG